MRLSSPSLKTLILTLLLSSMPLAAAFAQAEEVAESGAIGTSDDTAWRAEKQEEQAMWSLLQNHRVVDAEYGEIRVSLDEANKALLEGERTKSLAGPGYLVGLHVPVGRIAGLSSETFSKASPVPLGYTSKDKTGGLVWTSSVEVVEATALRIHFTDFYLPEGTELYVYNDEGQVHGPYFDRGPHGTGEFWSNTVFGEHAWLQVHSTDAKPSRASFAIEAVSHLGPGFELADRVGKYAKADCSRNVSCVENAECYDLQTTLGYARRAAAKITFEEGGGSYICSGGMINDSDGSGNKPWFLTAGHCIESESAANSLEAFFQYQSSCGSCSGSYSDSVLGADLWAWGATSNGDFALLELSELPSSWALMGWTTGAVYDDTGTQLYRISHPKGSPQSFSQHEVISNSSSKWVLTDPVIGTIEGGSSGSPIFKDNQQIVGQLYGITYSGSYDLCDGGSSFNTRDGAFSYYWKSVKPYLGSTTATNKMHVSAVAAGTYTHNFGFFKLYAGKATVTVVDELGNPVPRATVTVTFSGGLTGSYPGVTNDDGQATIIHPALLQSKPSFTACVSAVTQDYFESYDSASNDVTCASR